MAAAVCASNRSNLGVASFTCLVVAAMRPKEDCPTLVAGFAVMGMGMKLPGVSRTLAAGKLAAGVAGTGFGVCVRLSMDLGRVSCLGLGGPSTS